MSNYKPRIESNNLDLTSILENVEALPDAKPEQTKTATPSLSQQTISPDSGKVLSGVTVEPITSTLLTSLDSDFKAENIAEGVDMFGVTGIYAGGSGEPGELGTPTVNTSTGIVTATITKGGVLEEGTSTTLQLSKQAAKTVTPSSSAQTAVAAGRYTTGAVNVAAIPSTYKRLATGTVTASNNKVTVSGLGFTPAHLCLISVQGNSQIVCSYDGNGYYSKYMIGVTCTFSSGSFTAISDYGGVSGQFGGTYNYVVWS